jgi:YHS domain-containing protein
MIRKVLVALALALGSLTLAAPACADQPSVHTPLLSRLAVGGYDPVAYFTDGRAVRGTTAHRITHQGYEYRFATAEHLAAFRANPARYLP